MAVRRCLNASKKPAVVIGAGLIGNEFAASMRHIGRDVTLIRHESGPLTDMFHLGSRWQFPDESLESS